MRKTISLILGLVVIIVVGIGFILFFPKIFGEAVYPLEFRDEILASSSEFGVERNMIAAIIYSESRFRPDAGSHAGAKGLMQLMPATARGVAKQLGMTDYKDSDVFDPKTNIRLGTAYFKSQMDKYGGDVGAALAHYNGGPRAGGAYIEGRRDLMPRETQNYYRNVQAVWQAYDSIYGKNWDGGTGGPDFQPQTQPKSFIDTFQLDEIIKVLFGQSL